MGGMRPPGVCGPTLWEAPSLCADRMQLCAAFRDWLATWTELTPTRLLAVSSYRKPSWAPPGLSHDDGWASKELGTEG